MAKLVLSDLSSLANDPSAVNTINTNSAAIETALENTLSRDGTSPNAMGAHLDMNGWMVINLSGWSSTTGPANFTSVSVNDTVTASQTTYTGIVVEDPTNDGTAANYALRLKMAASSIKWNVYADGTAKNHFAGAVLIGTTTDNGSDKLQVTGTTTLTGNTTVTGTGTVTGLLTASGGGIVSGATGLAGIAYVRAQAAAGQTREIGWYTVANSR